MTTLRKEIIIDISADKVWSRLRDVQKTHELFSGVLVDSRVNGDIRTVIFANGMQVDERIVTIDDDLMRIAYAVQGDQFVEHAASMEIAAVNKQQCRFIWISDFLPDANSALVAPLMEQGCVALKHVLEIT
jgi:hypothetical protein